MRVALVVPGFSAHADDWAIPALLNLARGLASDCDLHIFSQRYPARGMDRFDGFTHYAVGGGQKFGLASLKIWLQTARSIVRQHDHTPFDLIHAFWADEAGFSAVLAGMWISRPVVVSLGGGELTHLPAIDYGAQRFLARRLSTRFALAKAALVTAGSNYQLELGQAHGVPATKLRLAPLGVDTERFRPAGGPERLWGPDGPPTVIQVASLLPVKNQALLLEVLAQVRNDLAEIELKLVGSGPGHERLVELAQKLNLSHNIHWRQEVPFPELVRHYHQADLYLQTSHHESQGMAVLEAMACGLPVIGTPVGVVKDLACLPPQTSGEALAAQVVKIFSNKARYLELRHRARQTIIESYSLPVVIDLFHKIYQDAVRETRNAFQKSISPF